jgi:hypothetical protein
MFGAGRVKYPSGLQDAQVFGHASLGESIVVNLLLGWDDINVRDANGVARDVSLG